MSKRVVVIGGGIIGLCVAYCCAAKGHDVVMLERGEPERDGCSFANAGMIVPSHFVPLASPGAVALALRSLGRRGSPLYVKPRASAELVGWGLRFMQAANRAHVERAAPLLRDLHLASRACFLEWAARFDNAFDLVERGLLMLCRTERALAEEVHVAEFARRLDMPATVLDAAGVSAVEPGMRMSVAGGVHFPLDGHVSPAPLMATLLQETQGLGATLRHRVDVRAFRMKGERIAAVDTSDDIVEGDEFVLCAGIWSSRLAWTLGLSLPMQAGKGYSLTQDDPPASPGVCAILSEARVAVTPMGRTLRFGGTMEITGIDERVDRLRVRCIVDSIAAYYPGMAPSHFANATIRSGLRPCSPDGLPYIGRFRRFENLSVATGHAMIGVSLAPITGRLIAQLLSGEAPSLDIALLDPDRFARRVP